LFASMLITPNMFCEVRELWMHSILSFLSVSDLAILLMHPSGCASQMLGVL
jgi:hypothetical protein